MPHENPYPPAPPPAGRVLRWYHAYWPPLVSVLALVILLVVLTADLVADWRVEPAAMPGYATLFGIAATGASISRKGGA